MDTDCPNTSDDGEAMTGANVLNNLSA